MFFREKARPPVAVYKDSPREPETAQAPSSDSEGAARGFPKAEARRQAAADSFAATGIGRETSFPVQWVAFEEDPTPAARIAIRYEFHEQLVRLGVLPREDDLYARENASGFEHRYAPDPYGHDGHR